MTTLLGRTTAFTLAAVQMMLVASVFTEDARGIRPSQSKLFVDRSCVADGAGCDFDSDEEIFVDEPVNDAETEKDADADVDTDGDRGVLVTDGVFDKDMRETDTDCETDGDARDCVTDCDDVRDCGRDADGEFESEID